MDTSWGFPTYVDYSPRKLEKCPTPSTIGIVVDGKCRSCNNMGFDVRTRALAITYFDSRHSGRINSLFVDIHVDSLNTLQSSDQEIATYYYLPHSKWP